MHSPRLLPLLLGPELYWAIVLLVLFVLCRQNVPATEQGNDLLARAFWLIPLVFVPLSFVCFAVPGAARWALLLRLDVATFIGVVGAAWMLGQAIDYRDSRNSGVGTGVLLSIILGPFVLGIGNLATALIFWLKRAPAS